jgi:hypothetical protein
MADAHGGNRQRFRRYKAILASQQLEWLVKDARSTSSRLLRVMDELERVQEWRATLSEREQVRWSSPQSVYNRILDPRRHERMKVPRRVPLTLRAGMNLPSTEAAYVLMSRNMPKAAAISRALAEAFAAAGARPMWKKPEAPRSFGEIVAAARRDAIA